MSDAEPNRDESRVVQRLLDALSEEANRAILSALDEPTPVAELVEECEIPMSTVYRRLDALDEMDLVTEHVTIGAEKGRYRLYERNVSRVTISVDEAGRLRTRVERPADSPDEEVTWRPSE
jgi:DNA-binding transcriptional ArsR family regulator